MNFNDHHKNSVKMKLISYKLLSKGDNKDINNELKKAGVFSRGKNKNEGEVWRVKNQELKPTTAPEEKYFINEIIKQYLLNTSKYNDGLNYKYFQNFTDLLTKRNDQKIYPKKRLELFYSRINNSKKRNLKNSFSNNFFLDPCLNKKVKKNRNTTFITYIESLNKTKRENFRGKTNTYMSHFNYFRNDDKDENLNDFYNTYNPYKSFYSIDQSHYNNFLKGFNNFTPIENKTQAFIRNNNKINFSNDTSSFFATQYNSNDHHYSIDDEIPAKEELIKTGDKSRYLEFLKNKYKFFNNPKLIQLKYHNEKKRRIRLFQKLPNSKFLDKKIKDAFKYELFNKIKRENVNKYFTISKTKVSNRNKRRIPGISLKETKKDIFDKEFKNILSNIQKTSHS